METHKLKDYRGKPGWIRARLDENKIVLEAGPEGGAAVNEFALETEPEVRELIRYLESLKRSYGSQAAPPLIKGILRTHLRVSGRKGWLRFEWFHLGGNDWKCSIGVSTSDVDQFIHDLMHLAWMLPETSHGDG